MQREEQGRATGRREMGQRGEGWGGGGRWMGGEGRGVRQGGEVMLGVISLPLLPPNDSLSFSLSLVSLCRVVSFAFLLLLLLLYIF